MLELSCTSKRSYDVEEFGGMGHEVMSNLDDDDEVSEDDSSEVLSEAQKRALRLLKSDLAGKWELDGGGETNIFEGRKRRKPDRYVDSDCEELLLADVPQHERSALYEDDDDDYEEEEMEEDADYDYSNDSDDGSVM